jgi:hypothetical protein
MKNQLLCFISIVLSFAGFSRQLHAQVVSPPPDTFKLGTGFDYSRGSYGFTSDTEVWSVPAILVGENQNWQFRATIPYLTVKGPANVIGDTGAAIAGPARPTAKSESGLGDIVAGLTFHTNPTSQSLKVDLTGRVKFPTADDAKGLGTGKTDYYGQVDLYQTFDAITPFGTVGYRFLGDTPTIRTRDGLYATAGLIFRAAPGTSVGAGYDWREKLVSGGDDSTDAMIFVTHNATDRVNIVLYALKGFDSGSPDYGFGGQITYKF